MNSQVKTLIENMKAVIVGKETAIEKVVICLLSDGHVLLEDVPGVGKTTMVHALAKSMDADFKRIQFTPDLLPSDITGVSIFNQQTNTFEFNKGPIFSHIILADEINRTSPKTQSSLLEAMQEGQITFDGDTYPLPDPFVVLATQNPIEYEGTFPLPESQLDRFMMKISVGYPGKEDEKEMIRRFETTSPLKNLKPVLTIETVNQLKREAQKVYVHSSIVDYIIDIVSKTRKDPNIYLGVSPRGTLAFVKAARGHAYIKGRSYVIPDDVKEVLMPVLSHRIILKPEARIQGITNEERLNTIKHETRVPRVTDYE